MDFKQKVRKFSKTQLCEELKIQRKKDYNSFETYWCIFRLKEMTHGKELAREWSLYATRNIWASFGVMY